MLSDLKADNASIMLYNKNSEELSIIESVGLSLDSTINITFKIGEGVAGKAFSTKKCVIVTNTQNDNEFKHFNFQRENIMSIISQPLVDNDTGEVIAVVNLSATRPAHFNEATSQYISNYSGLIINALKNLNLQDTQTLNFIDANTGLYNYSFFIENLKREIDRAERYNEIFSLILIRISNFNEIIKKWEDIDIKKSLKYFAQFLKNTSRRVDICSIYDYNTFAIITPETGKGGAQKKVDRLLQNVENNKYYPDNIKNLPKLTISCSISSYPGDGKNYNDLLNHCLSQF